MDELVCDACFSAFFANQKTEKGKLYVFPALSDKTVGTKNALIPSGNSGYLTVKQVTSLGRCLPSGEPVVFNTRDRAGGLYVLGKARTGKSNLLISMALQDIEHGHGLMFIDPHTDAIRELLTRLPDSRERDVILLDPTNEEYAFSLNPLECADPENFRAVSRSYNRTHTVFTKAFANPETGRLDILLEQYLRNSIYPLLASPGSTLLELREFLRNKTFRDAKLRNLRRQPEIVEFWQKDFDRKPKGDQQIEVESTLRRLNPLLIHPEIRHMFAQAKSTINFTHILNERKIVLLRMPVDMDDEAKRFIGTLVISELLNAVFERADSDEGRSPFALYCDEFQEFATPDFARLFSQTGKFNIMPAVAHQVRGQFRLQDPNREATLGAPNKIVFSLSPTDAREFAPVYADKPTPAEVRLERQLAISQHPLKDLLEGSHPNPEIKRFARRYLRPLAEKVEDLRDDMEFVRLIRMDFFDQAMLFRIEDSIEAAANPRSIRGGSLSSAHRMAEGAHRQTQRLLEMHEAYCKTKWTIRGFNKFFTAIMEGEVKPGPGEERFAQFLVDRARSYNRLPALEAHALELFIQLEYGNPDTIRLLSLDIALSSPLHKAEAGRLVREAEEQTRKDREEYTHRHWHKHWHWGLSLDGVPSGELMPDAPEAPRLDPDEHQLFMCPWLVDRLPGDRKRFEEWYQKNQNWWLRFEPRLGEVRFQKVEEGRKQKFERDNVYTPRDQTLWRECWDVRELYSSFYWILNYPEIRAALQPFTTRRFSSDAKRRLIPFGINWHIDEIKAQFGRKFGSEKAPIFGRKDTGHIYHFQELFKPSVVGKILEFIAEHKEGALVVFYLACVADTRFFSCLFEIEDQDPLELCGILRRVNGLMLGHQRNNRDFFNHFSYEATWYRSDGKRIEYTGEPLRRGSDNTILLNKKDTTKFELREWPFKVEFEFDYKSEGGERLLQAFLSRISQSRLWWQFADEDARNYVLGCVCARIYSYNHEAWPALRGEALTTVKAFENLHRQLVLEEARAWAKERMADLSESQDRELPRLIAEHVKETKPPAELVGRVLNMREREDLKKVCWDILSGFEMARKAWAVIEEFVEFCRLLSQPENHLMRASGVYAQKQVLPRQVRDMEAEKAQELMRLDEGIAYFNGKRDGQEIVVKLRTDRVDDLFPRLRSPSVIEQIVFHNGLRQGHLRKREVVEKEIEGLRNQWQSYTRPKPEKPATTRKTDKPPPAWC